MGYRVLNSERVAHRDTSPIAPQAQGPPAAAPVVGTGQQRSPTWCPPTAASVIVGPNRQRSPTGRSPPGGTWIHKWPAGTVICVWMESPHHVCLSDISMI
jgi:hypothetical protein